MFRVAIGVVRGSAFFNTFPLGTAEKWSKTECSISGTDMFRTRYIGSRFMFNLFQGYQK